MNGQRKHYHSIPLRTQARPRVTADDAAIQQTRRMTRPAPQQSFVPRQQMPLIPHEDQQYTLPTVMPRSARRYVDETGNEVFQQGNKRMIVTYGKPPKRFHWLLFVGVGMLATILLWVGLNAVGTWWSNHQLDSQYGNPRTWQTDEVV